MTEINNDSAKPTDIVVPVRNDTTGYILAAGSFVSFVSAYTCDHISVAMKNFTPNLAKDVSEFFGMNLKELVGAGSIITCAALFIGFGCHQIIRNNRSNAAYNG